MRRITLRFSGNLSHKDLQLDWVICCSTLCITQQTQRCAWFTSLKLTYSSEKWWWKVSSPSWCLDQHKPEDVWYLHGIFFFLFGRLFFQKQWYLLTSSETSAHYFDTNLSRPLCLSLSSFQRCCMLLMCCPPVSFGTLLTARLFKGSTSGNGFWKGQQMAVTVAKCCITLYNNSSFL